MAKNYVRENVPLSRFGVLVAQLESIVASAAQQSPDALLCFDLLSDLTSAIDEEPKESILLWQRKCEDALYSLLILGARRPVRHLASLAMARIISRGDGISIYSRTSSLQGLLSDGKRSEPLRAAGAAQCLGELYHHFGKRITSGLLETTNIAGKLMKFYEDFVRQEAMEMLQNALEGSGGNGASAAYTEAFRLIMRIGVGDKSIIVRIAAARCLKTFANIGGPGLGVTELEHSCSYCVKALEDPVSSVRDAFAEALGALLALGMNPDAQIQPKGKSRPISSRTLEGGLQKHLSFPFTKANGLQSKELRIGLTLSWVFFLQAMRLKYLHPDGELATFALQAMDMLRGDSAVDAHALACVLYILRVGVIDQMTETNQRSILVLLGSQLESPELNPSIKVAVLHTLSYILTTLGEVPQEFKEILDNTIVAALSHPEILVRTEAALSMRALAEVDPTCVGGLISYAVTTLNALRESISFEKGDNLKIMLDSMHGQAAVIAALVSISPKLHLGYPARLPLSVLEVSKKMLTESSRNPVAASVEKEAGWMLLASILASMPKEELEDQVFDVLSLWATLFTGNPEFQLKQAGDLTSQIRIWSAAVDALTAFIRCFIPTIDTFCNGILLQPVLMYLGRALSYISLLGAKQLPDMRPAMDLFTIRTLIAYQSLSDPMAYKNDHRQLIQICTTPFREPSGSEESSCLRMLLDKRDASLGPWIPGRDWFEDELRAFQGGKDGLMPCVWEKELPTFPQPEMTSKMLVNQMLLCFGVLFATKDSGEMLLLLGTIEQCLKSGKKQSWHSASLTNACVALLAALKSSLALRPQPMGLDVLRSTQAIFQGILSEGDISSAQRRASCEGLGLLARFGNDVFTARMTRSLLGDLVGATDLSYIGSIALSLGCIHRSAGGMALSTLVPATVNSISLLAKSPNASLQIWSLHGLLLTVEAAGLSFVSQVQGTLLLAMEILLSDENGGADLRQGIGRLINAIVAVLGPELAPGSIFFSRCKSVVAEISSRQETSTLLESVRFTQQLVLFAPQAVSVHIHVKTLLPTLSSRQPTLRHLAVSTLRHLIETDPIPIIKEHIEENLFHMLDEETDPEIGNLVRATISQLLYKSCPSCPSLWISICHSMILAVPRKRNNSRSDNDPPPGLDGDTKLYYGEDDENMVTNAANKRVQASTTDSSGVDYKRGNHLRYRTRIFAAECLNHLPTAVGNDPAHFDLSLAKNLSGNGKATSDWLVLHIQELISLAYQISTIQFENMQPIGVQLLCTVIEKFENTPDPELPGHFLMEQYQAQFVSAVRTALNASSGPLLLEAGLHLATKILTSSITSGDQAAVKRIFSLISRPLDDFKDLYYPSFAEWVACKIRIRLLAAHASVKTHVYSFLRKQNIEVPNEYLALIPQFSKNSMALGKYWICILKDYSYLCFHLLSERNFKPFLDGIQSPLVSSKLQQSFEEAWPVILQAVSLDAIPVKHDIDPSSEAIDPMSKLISGYRMVELEPKEFKFLWGFALLVLFQGHNSVIGKQIRPLINPHNAKSCEDPMLGVANNLGPKAYEIALLVFHSLSMESFLALRFLTAETCKELFQVLSYLIQLEYSWTILVIQLISQIVQDCPKEFFEMEDFATMALELCVTCLYKIFKGEEGNLQFELSGKDMLLVLFVTMEKLIGHSGIQMQLRAMLALLSTIYSCLRGASSGFCFPEVANLLQRVVALLKKCIIDEAKLINDISDHLRLLFGAWQNAITSTTEDCVNGIHLLPNKMADSSKLLKVKLAFSLEQAFSLAKLANETRQFIENKDNDHLFFAVYRCCIECTKTTINDSDMQVQTIGLQVLKGMAQRELGQGSNGENHLFFMFFIGEHLGDLLHLIQKILKKPATRDSVVVASECLKLLFLLQTLSRVTECQKSLVNLLLEVIIIIVSASDNDLSQEFVEIRSTALRFVSHLAQVPSSAVHFRDVLLAMPITNRQKLQDIIRASVTLDRDSTQTSPPAPPPIIKLPTQMQRSTTGDSQVIASESATIHTDNDSTEENDDWDAFQSFPAASDANTEMDRNENKTEPVDTNNDEFKIRSSQPLENSEASSNDRHDPEGDVEEINASRQGEGNDVQELHGHKSTESKPVASNEKDACEVSKTIQDNNFQTTGTPEDFTDCKELKTENLVEESQQNTEAGPNGGNDIALSDPLPVVDGQVLRLEPQVATDGMSLSDEQH